MPEEEKVVPPEGAEEETTVEKAEEETTVETVAEEEGAVIEETPPVPPKKKTAQERIDEITHARRDAEREREYWKNIALAKEKKEPETIEAPAIPTRPTLDQFETTVEYEDALFEWRDKVMAVKARDDRARTEQETALQNFNKKAKKIREEHEDFDEVIEAPVFSSAMRIILLNSDNGPEVAYFLGRPENKDVADKIRSLPAERQAYEIGKLETNLLLAQKTKKVPGAPPPN